MFSDARGRRPVSSSHQYLWPIHQAQLSSHYFPPHFCLHLRGGLIVVGVANHIEVLYSIAIEKSIRQLLCSSNLKSQAPSSKHLRAARGTPISLHIPEVSDANLAARLQGHRDFTLHQTLSIWLYSAIFLIIYTDNYIIID